MGCSPSSSAFSYVEKDVYATSSPSELRLLRERIKELYTFKILTLGASEAGKSTIVKQLRLLHGLSLHKDEIKSITNSLHLNAIDCVKAMAEACVDRGIPLQDTLDRKTVAEINRWGGRRMSVELGNRVYRVWQSDAMQKVYKARHQYWHLSAIDYYMEHITRFCKTDFVPSPEDTLVARIRTTGIAHIKLEENLKGHGKEADKASEHTERARNSTRDREKDRNEVNNSNTTKTTRPQNPMNKHIDVRSDHYHHHEHRPKEVLFDIVDVGGQRNEREKWAYEADKTRAILFVVNLAGYNQVMFEDQKKNRLEEAIHLYHDIHNHPLFALHGDNNNRTKAYPSRIYLVLNKKDLFQEMIKHTPLHQVPAFQDCTDTDSDGCIAYILSRFNDQSTLPASSKPVQPFVISALDEREVGTMWQHIKTDIVESNQPWIEKQAQGAVRAIKQASASAGKRKDNMDREKNGTRRIMVSSALGVGANARERRQ